MYAAKRLGGNRIHFYSKDLQEDSNRRAALEAELLGSLEDDRCVLLYQPQVDLSTGLISGAQAQVHVRSKGGALLSLSEFMSAAEYSGLLSQLWGWELRRACADLAMLHEISPDLGFTLGLSARQLRGIDAGSLCEPLDEFGLKARYLSLEITEATLSSDVDVARKLEELRTGAGIGLSLSDFGRAHPSPELARTFRGGTIRIDRRFVSRLPTSTEASAMVLSAIALAQGLGARAVADGPETDEQIRFLRANGCDAAQGFYFGYPASAEELALLLRGEPFTIPV
jgi:EAL domain-containing protein (putative c-di-GMP-specific phosphodiesterase class I)